MVPAGGRAPWCAANLHPPSCTLSAYHGGLLQLARHATCLQGCICPWLQAVLVLALLSAGASGAALVDSAGQCLGLVTSNTRHSAAGSFPHWSFAIAAAQLQPVVACLHGYSSSSSSSRQAVSALQQLDIDDAELRKLWLVGNLSLPLGQNGSERKNGKSMGPQGAERLSQLVGQSRLAHRPLPAAVSRL